jgi:hypothetical protein
MIVTKLLIRKGHVRDANQRTHRLGGTFVGEVLITAKVGSGAMNTDKREQEKPQ